MNSKTSNGNNHRAQEGTALLLTLVASGIGLLMVGGIISYSASGVKLNARAQQYQATVAAAEGAAEKVVSQMTVDYQSGGEALVQANLDRYRQMVPSAADSGFWQGWEFSDASGNASRTFVNRTTSSSYTVLNSTYAGLKGYASTYSIVSNARQPGTLGDVTGALLEQVQLARIPVFQFAMYSSGDMEISCGQPFTITGRIHSNGQLYVEPDNLLSCQSGVSAVGSVLFQRSPLDSRGAPIGSVVYDLAPMSHVPAMVLPIGVTNTPISVREIIEPPPSGEDANSPMGRQRYYNLTDMILVVTNSGTNFSVTGVSGRFNGSTVSIPTNEVALFVSTSASFLDTRESKTVRPIDINVGALTAWSATNSNVRVALGSRNVSSVYVLDARGLSGSKLGAVRLFNGTQLPANGLTVATLDPVYVWGNYNQTSATNLGTANTSTTLPASIAADAITILSGSWSDANSTADVSARNASPTTVNAAFLAGAVETAGGAYGGGMENFPRFLETWGLGNQFTFNGSMVKMFPSLYATSSWGHTNVYGPPKRAWSYDLNFEDPTKLPPLTPGLYKVVRSLWTTLPPNRTSVAATP